MAINLEIVTDAFQKTGIVDENESPSAEQGANALRLLNDYLLAQARDGMRLGWYTQSDLSANAPLRPEDVWGVKVLLAGQLATAYGLNLQDNPTLVADIEMATKMLTKKSIRYFESDFGELSRAQGSPWGSPGWI